MSMDGVIRTVTAMPSEGYGRTIQSAKNECDINRIMARYQRDGMITHVNTRTPVYLNVSNVGSYQEAVDRVMAVQRFFEGLPAKVRQHFDNDAAKFLDGVSDPARAAEMKELGVIPAEKAPAAPVVP